VKDFMGRVIRPGDTIVYPGRRSSSLWLNKAKVVEVSERNLFVEVETNVFDLDRAAWVPVTRRTRIQAVERVVVVPPVEEDAL
jgi:hypothetical protein